MIKQTNATHHNRALPRHHPTMRILRQPEVIEMTGLSRTTIWRRVQDGSFPPPIRLGGHGTRAVGWRHTDIHNWFNHLSPTA